MGSHIGLWEGLDPIEELANVGITASGIGAGPKPGTHWDKCEGQADTPPVKKEDERNLMPNANDNQVKSSVCKTLDETIGYRAHVF